MRLGLDIGITSIGWWLYETQNGQITKVIDGGSRIFSNGRKPARSSKELGAPLAVDRRMARSMRRRRDRYIRRRAALMRKLSDSGLMPANPESAMLLEQLDPYTLRARGLDEALPLTHLGRALFHLNQRRGFKSNRKTDRGDNESGKIKDATARLEQTMMSKNARTYGEFLHIRRSGAPDARHVPSIRARLGILPGQLDEKGKEKEGYDFYPDRRHLEEEFSKLWAAQVTKHKEARDRKNKILAEEWERAGGQSDNRSRFKLKAQPVTYEPCPDVLTDELRDALFEIIFYQRPLKEPVIGLCLFSGQYGIPSDEKRLPNAHPLTQRRVLYETVNNLRITAEGREKRPLTMEQRDQIIHALDNKKPTKSLPSMKLKAIAKVIKLAPGERFTLETRARDAIACDPVRASLSHPDRFGPGWSKLDPDAQWEVIRQIRNVQSDEEHAKLITWIVENYGFDKDRAEAISNAPLPENYGRIGETATRKIVEALQSDVRTYSQAVEECGWHHSDQRTGEILDQLPYYAEILQRHVIPGSGDPKDDHIKRFGRITNPTVHIGLNQLRRLVNKIIALYGKPDEIVVELARDLKQSKKQKEETENRIKENTEAAKKRSKKLEELGQPDTGANRALLRLYEELGPAIGPRCCPYTGKPISVTMLFDGSCDIDHILPYSRTLDDSISNKTLCLREANRKKGNKTPWEIWGNTPQWNKIRENLENLPENKRWRFTPDAMERFEKDNDFAARALVDTQYLSRIATSYLEALYTEGGHVWAVTGRFTSMLRRNWGLNELLADREEKTAHKKNRTDHRHHAIDAAVVAATDRSLLQQISNAKKLDELNGVEDVLKKIPTPWEGFRKDVIAQLEKITVSHRADHGRIDPTAKKQGKDSTTGQLHNETAYGIVDGESVVSRAPFLGMELKNIDEDMKGKKKIRDPHLQKLLSAFLKGKEDKKDIEAALTAFAASPTLPNGKPNPYQGIRHVRLIENMQSSARIELRNKNGKAYKAYKGDSNHCYEIWRMPDGKIQAQVITTFEAHHPAGVTRPHPAAKRLSRFYKRDMVIIERDEKKEICYVQQMSDKQGLYLVPHNEANADARNRDKSDTFKFIQMRAVSLVKARIRRAFVDEMGHLRDPGAPPV